MTDVAPDAPAPLLRPWSSRSLQATAQALRDRPDHVFDLVVVGAGITGAGVARDAAMRGLDTLVLEASDLAFGTSSRSSRLIHGGVRYLEQGELGLVFEALRERARLVELAPHLVSPTPFMFPSFTEDRLQPWKLSLGLSLYDLLAMYRGQRHRRLSAARARALEPMLREEGLRGAVYYEDAVTDDARLTLANLQAAREAGAQVLTHTPVTGLAREGALHTVTVDGGQQIRARTVLLATGPWTGSRLLGAPGAELLTLSKGVHLVVPGEDAPVRAPVVIQVPGQRRILFAVPWGPRTYLGTTDSVFEGDPGDAGVTEADEEEVLELVRRVLGGANLRRDRIISAWSGVRPLVSAAGSRARGGTVELARTHRVVENEDGVLALVGGKLTTYRAMAQEAVDRICARLQAASEGTVPLRPCATHHTPLLSVSVDGPVEATDGTHGLPRELTRDLEQRRGAETPELLAAIAGDPGLAEPLVEGLPYRWVEVERAIEFEGARHLDDILRRRIPLALTDRRLGGGVMYEVARRLVRARGGPPAEVEQEVERYRELVTRETRRTPA